VFANGRLADANARPDDAATLARLRAGRPGAPLDRVALAWVLARPFVDVALSGAATVEQLRSHVAAASTPLAAEELAGLPNVAEAPARYWATRGSLPWT
jgi:aryl-alcohol dehydrogenase-like predicted oxidoreductase